MVELEGLLCIKSRTFLHILSLRTNLLGKSTSTASMPQNRIPQIKSYKLIPTNRIPYIKSHRVSNAIESKDNSWHVALLAFSALRA